MNTLIVPTNKTCLNEFAVYINNHRYVVTANQPAPYKTCLTHERIVRAMNELQHVTLPIVCKVYDTLQIEMLKTENAIVDQLLN